MDLESIVNVATHPHVLDTALSLIGGFSIGLKGGKHIFDSNNDDNWKQRIVKVFAWSVFYGLSVTLVHNGVNYYKGENFPTIQYLYSFFSSSLGNLLASYYYLSKLR